MVEVTMPTPHGYHHGHLHSALIEAGLALSRAGGPAALGLRDVTRQVGVSANAAYRHFTDRQALVRAVAERIQNEMADRMREPAPDPSGEPDLALRARSRLRAVGLGYIEFALSEPGWFEVAFGDIEPALSPDQADRPLPPPLAMLSGALDALAASGALSEGSRAGAEWPCWSTVHGFALLALHGPLRAQPADLVRSAAERSVEAIIAGLLGEAASSPIRT